MKVRCPSCHGDVPAADINIQVMQALCRTCNDVFPVSGGAAGAAPWHAEPEPPAPARFTIVTDTPRLLEASWRWWQWKYLFLVVWCMFWDGFLVVWYAAVIFGPHEGGMQLVAILFPLIHVAVGFFVTAFLIATIFNRTLLRCDGDDLVIRHGPVPWPGSRTIPLRELMDLRIGEKNPHNSDDSTSTFSLIATRNGRDITLLRDIGRVETRWLRWKLTAMTGPGR